MQKPILLLLILSMAGSASAQLTEDQVELNHSFHSSAESIGLTTVGGKHPLWEAIEKEGDEVVVAVIDSGVDFTHPEFDTTKNFWFNADEKLNGKDSDNNGYVDDLFGYDFIDGDNNPMDELGHGTMVAGIIALGTDRPEAVGLNPHARIMMLRALDSLGQSRSSAISEAIYYAIHNGAQIINLSLSEVEPSVVLKQALDYAHSKDVLLVAAAGNQNIDNTHLNITRHNTVIRVGALDSTGQRAEFSNHHGVDLLAPGTRVWSLRARGSDLMQILGAEDYQPGSHFSGNSLQYYRADGTSFAAPYVSALASLLLSQRPELSRSDIQRVLLQSAWDMPPLGVDILSGYGVLDAITALGQSKGFYLQAHIDEIKAVSTTAGIEVQVIGDSNADQFSKAEIYIGVGSQPTDWQSVNVLNMSVKNGVLGTLPINQLQTQPEWTVRLVTTHVNQRIRQAEFNLKLSP